MNKLIVNLIEEYDSMQKIIKLIKRKNGLILNYKIDYIYRLTIISFVNKEDKKFVIKGINLEDVYNKIYKNRIKYKI